MQLSEPCRAQAQAGSGVDNASLVPAAFSLCSQPSFFPPISPGTAVNPKLQPPAPYIILRPGKPETVAMLSIPAGNCSPKRSAPVPKDGSKTAACIKEFNLQIGLC